MYDGHAGKDAAAYAASHLHANILKSELYPKDVAGAIKDAFRQADTNFLEKGRHEVGRDLHFKWVWVQQQWTNSTGILP